jgi:hypothetical protein
LASWHCVLHVALPVHVNAHVEAVSHCTSQAALSSQAISQTVAPAHPISHCALALHVGAQSWLFSQPTAHDAESAHVSSQLSAFSQSTSQVDVLSQAALQFSCVQLGLHASTPAHPHSPFSSNPSAQLGTLAPSSPLSPELPESSPPEADTFPCPTGARALSSSAQPPASAKRSVAHALNP